MHFMAKMAIAPLLQSLVPHDTLETIIMCRFGAKFSGNYDILFQDSLIKKKKGGQKSHLYVLEIFYKRSIHCHFWSI